MGVSIFLTFTAALGLEHSSPMWCFNTITRTENSFADVGGGE